jgi:ubiquinone/menaquinone biosynthesis C-methylase UbiE
MDTSWNKVADWYDELVEGDDDSYQAKVLLPNLLRIVGNCENQSIIDIGCGQGFFSRALRDSGAKVIGIDLAPNLIKVAKEKEENKNSSKIDYRVLSASSLSGIEDYNFDKAISVLAIQNMDKYREVISEAFRVLKPEGKFIIILNHPAFRIPKHSKWIFENESQSRVIDRYLSESKEVINMEPGKGLSGEKTVSFHRSMQDYMKVLFNSGFTVTRFEEWISHKKSQKGTRQKIEDTARKEFPLFLMIEAKKNNINN